MARTTRTCRRYPGVIRREIHWKKRVQWRVMQSMSMCAVALPTVWWCRKMPALRCLKPCSRHRTHPSSMPKLPPVSSKKLIRILSDCGFVQHKETGSSHAVFTHPDGRCTVVPRHGNRDRDRKYQCVLLHPARIFSVNMHALYSGLPRRLASANCYGSLLAKTGNEAMVMYEKDGFLFVVARSPALLFACSHVKSSAGRRSNPGFCNTPE